MPIASIQWKMADYYKASFVEDATINIVEGTTNIPYAMFANGSASYTSAGTYDHVLKVNFPKSLKTLEGSAFFKRNIVNTDFSATSLESIGESCFAYNY